MLTLAIVAIVALVMGKMIADIVGAGFEIEE